MERFTDVWGNKPIDYGVNTTLAGKRRAVRAPTKLLFVGDAMFGRLWYATDERTYRHFGGDCFCFYDGHVAWWDQAKEQKYITVWHDNRLPLANGIEHVGGQSDID